MSKEKTYKVRFLVSPTGRYRMAYEAGEVASLPIGMAVEIVGNEDAEFVGKGPTDAEIKKYLAKDETPDQNADDVDEKAKK